MTDRRKFNIPPKPPKYEKTYDKVLSIRVVDEELKELKRPVSYTHLTLPTNREV